MTARARVVARWLVLAVLVAMTGVDVSRVVRRMGFDYDWLLWGDDYFMTSMAKLAAGQPVYTRLADANSTVYSPGGPWLHHALLGLLGLDTSLLANRILNQCWLALALVLATRTVLVLTDASFVVPVAGKARALLTVTATTALAVTAYANPVADSLHPTELELVVLSATTLALASFERLGPRTRPLLLLLLPSLGVLAKQTAGPAVALALAVAAILDRGRPPRRRALFAALPFVGVLVTLAGLTLATHGLFALWGFVILSRHPFDWWKVSDLYRGYFLLFVPALLTLIASVRSGVASRETKRVTLLVLAYTPFALAALFKTMGGPNNLAVVGFLLVQAALPVWLALAFGESKRSVPRLAGPVLVVLALVQTAVLRPRIRVPDAHDRDNARLICDYAARRMQCGERVHLGRGSVCYARGGVAVPTDRLSSIVEVTVAGMGDELGFRPRVRAGTYDVLILPMNDLLWYRAEFWRELRAGYSPFFSTHGELDNDFWFDGWQGYVSWPMIFFERSRDAGHHHVSAGDLLKEPCAATPASR